MVRLTFEPLNETLEAEEGNKILLVATRAGIDIRFGCGAGRCGTCGVRIVEGADNLSPPLKSEIALLDRMGLPTDGSVRLACRTKVLAGGCTVDLAFQDTYSPDDTE